MAVEKKYENEPLTSRVVPSRVRDASYAEMEFIELENMMRSRTRVAE